MLPARDRAGPGTVRPGQDGSSLICFTHCADVGMKGVLCRAMQTFPEMISSMSS
jgi:hypothetical protein